MSSSTQPFNLNSKAVAIPGNDNPAQNFFQRFVNQYVESRGWDRNLAKVGLVLGAFLVTLFGSTLIGATDLGIYIVLGLVSLIFVVNIIIQPYIGLYIVVVFVYLNISWIFTDNFDVPSINRPMVALVAGSVFATRILLQREKLVFRRTEVMIMLYMFALAFSTVLGANTNPDVIDSILDLAKEFLLIIVIVQLVYKEAVWKRAQWLFIVAALFVSVLSWYQTFSGDFETDFMGFASIRGDSVGGDGEVINFERASGQIGEPNYYAQVLLMVFPMAFYRAMTETSRNMRALGWVCTIFIVGTILFTYSRAATLAVGAITVLMLLDMRWPLYKIITLGLVTVALALPVLPAGFAERMLALVGLGGTQQRQDVSVQGRTSEMLVAMQMFRDYPIFGIGYAQYEDNYLRYSSALGLDPRYENRQAHSIYFEMAGETGLFGTTTFGLSMILIFIDAAYSRRLLREIKREDLIPWLNAVQFGLVAYMISSIFLHDDYVSYLRLIIAFLLGSTAFIQRLHREEMLRRASLPELAFSR